MHIIIRTCLTFIPNIRFHASTQQLNVKMPSIQFCYSGTDHISSMPNVIAFINFMITYTAYISSSFFRFSYAAKHFEFVFHSISGATENQIERMWC